MNDQLQPLAADLVREFVAVCHGDLNRVQELIGRQPALVNAAWDWGGGDWETGLGAAAHTGQRDIAIFLLSNGARIDLFAAAMLGQLDMIKAALDAFPGALLTPGPHGIPLMEHARMGGEQAGNVLTYFQTLQAQSENLARLGS